MSKKTVSRKTGKEFPGLVNVGRLSYRVDNRILSQYNNGGVSLIVTILPDYLRFRFFFGNGITFEYGIDNEKEVKAFVDFIQKSHELITNPKKRKQKGIK